MIDSPIAQPQPPSHHNTEPQASYSAVADAPIAHKPLPLRPQERSDTDDSAWDIVDDLPLLWATHYTPLASAGSRLHNSSVLFYDLWRNENARSRGAALLAVATKSNIFLYEAPKGERAFHLIKVCHSWQSSYSNGYLFYDIYVEFTGVLYTINCT